MPIVDSTFLAGPRVQPIIRRGQGAGGGEGGSIITQSRGAIFHQEEKIDLPTAGYRS